MGNEKEPIIHPYYAALYLLISGLAMAFLALTAAYLYNRVQEGLEAIDVPILFYINTIFLLLSSHFMIKARRAYDLDDISGLRNALVTTLFLSAVFFVLQVWAWEGMLSGGLILQGEQTTSYLFLIPMLHLLHVVGGLPFLVVLLIRIIQKSGNPTALMIFFSDSSQKRYISLLATYWHFVDLLWIYLVVFFSINALI